MSQKLYIKTINFKLHSFHFFGVTGYLLGTLIGMALASIGGLNSLLVLLMSGIGASVFFLLALLGKRLAKAESIVYYHHEIAILLTCTVALWLLNQSILPYLDITIIGIGVFLAFGRIGCYSVGCCHGRPCKHGVRYTQAHVEEGFPYYYKGVTLFPIQLLESAYVLLTVAFASYLVLEAKPPGTALIIYTVVYGFCRFVLEFYRGDPERPYWLGFSEAQWTTLGLFVITVKMSQFGWLPYYAWHYWSLAVLALLMAVTAIVRELRAVPTHKILNPRHVWEILNEISALEREAMHQNKIPMVKTSLGLQLTKSKHTGGGQTFVHYTISGQSDLQEKKQKTKAIKVNREVANVIGKFLQRIMYPNEQLQVHEAHAGIYHLIFEKPRDATISPSLNNVFQLKNKHRFLTIDKSNYSPS